MVDLSVLIARLARLPIGGPPQCGPGRRYAAPAAHSALVRVEPVERAGDRLLPVAEVLVALVGVHGRLPALVLDPVLAQVLLLASEPGGEPRRVGGPERRGLGHLRPDHRHAE